MIYLNTASAGLPHPDVTQVLQNHRQLEQELTPLALEEYIAIQINLARSTLANYVNADTNEIAFFDSASRAFNEILLSIDWQPGDEIITTEAEYGSNWLSLLWLVKHYQVNVKILPYYHGLIDLNALKQALNSKTKFVSIAHLGSHGGLFQPLAEIGEILTNHHALYCVDAAQSAGQISLDVKKIKCDILITTGRKYLAGPRQTAFAYIDKNRLKELEPKFPNLFNVNSFDKSIDWCESSKKFEQKEKNYAAIIALARAVEIIHENAAGIESRKNKICDYLNNLLAGYKKIFISNCFIHCYDFGENTDHVLRMLAEQTPAIQVQRWRFVSSPLSIKAKTLKECMRVSPHYYTTEDELNYFSYSLAKILK